MLRTARERAGLGLRHAARCAGVGHGCIWLLENAQRAPSTTVAGLLIEVLRLDATEADLLRAHTRPGVGRDYVRYR